MAGAAAVVLCLCACASQPSAPSEREIAAAQQEAQTLAARGYQPAALQTSDQFVEAWTSPDGALMVDVLMPRDVVAAPVVVYLPGIDGPADEGERWRRAWANAGYAVLSVQRPTAPKTDPRPGPGANNASAAPPSQPPSSMPPSPTSSSSQPPTPPGGRGGVMGGTFITHREIDAPVAVATRRALAQFALAEIANRAAQHRAPYDRMDTTRMAIAGFDLGADTALALAGARSNRDAAPIDAPSVHAVIALVPYVDTTRANPALVYASIGLPVLTVSGTADADRHGLVDDPHARLAPYTFMPAGGKGLLVLEGGLYDTLAGSLRAIEHGGPRGETDVRQHKRGGDNAGGSMDRGSMGGGGVGGGGMGGGGMGGGGMGGGPMGGGGGMAGGPPGGGRGGAPNREPAQAQIEPYAQYVIVEQVTTAYLDAYLKDDPIAAEWLQRNAARWAGARAQWQMK